MFIIVFHLLDFKRTNYFLIEEICRAFLAFKMPSHSTTNKPFLDFRFYPQLFELLRCPKDASELKYKKGFFTCKKCNSKYVEQNGIIQLFSSNEWDSSKEDITDKMQKFYEKTPFPNYDDVDDAGSLIDKASKGYFARLLDDSIPYGSKVIECGCGTGQLSNFLSISQRMVVGADLCMNSLRLAQSFKEKNQLENVKFLQMNLFRPPFRSESFDYVISNGVLHHTSDPKLAFQSISSLLKPNGYIVVGLYHKWGRIWTDIRRVIFNLTKDKTKYLDHRNVDSSFSESKRRAWFMDQYKNPHESKHTILEVMDWFKESGFEFIKSIPKSKFLSKLDNKESLFEREEPATRLECTIKEVLMTVTNAREGGFFIVIGKKKNRVLHEQ